MRRLIDANELITALYHYEHEDGEIDAYTAQDIINSAPSIDIVRCGECKRRKKNKFCLEHGRYEKNDDGFCSYGERKEQ